MVAVKQRKNFKKLILQHLPLVVASSVLYVLLVRLGFAAPLLALPDIVCLNSCLTDEKIHEPVAGDRLLNYQQSVEQLVGKEIDKSKTSILIEKSKHRLTLYYDRKPIKSYPVVFGEPLGDKRQEGDLKTPEGLLRIQDLYTHPSWSKFLWLDYPNPNSWRKHFQAKVTGQLSWLATIGGEVGIHGLPQGADNLVDTRSNWTLGCPSLKNSDVDELYSVVQVGTIVEIVP